MVAAYSATAIASASVSAIVIRALIPMLRKRGVLDVPNARSSHAVPVPRGGGFGVVAGIVVGIAVAAFVGPGALDGAMLAAIAVIAACGAADDLLGGIPARVRLAVQTAMASVIVWRSGGVPLTGEVETFSGFAFDVLAVIWIVAVTNIYNFLDGIDGFAGLQAVVAGVALAVVAPTSGITAVSFAIVGSAAGFLLYNWHPARIFMGDAGSTTLGFVFAALPFQAASPQRTDLIFCVAMFLWFFLADGVWTLCNRAARGEAFWTPHRSHLYQQLTRAGLRHDAIAGAVMSMAGVLCCIVSVGRITSTKYWPAISLLTAVAMFTIYVIVVRHFMKKAAIKTHHSGGKCTGVRAAQVSR